MTRLTHDLPAVRLISLALLLLIPNVCQAQSITVTRGDWSRTIPQADFKALERAIEVDGQPGDRVHITGEFVGGPLDMLDLNKIAGGELTGSGPEKSRLIFHAQHDRIGPVEKPQKIAGPALLFPDNGAIRIAGLYLECKPDNIREDGALGGWTNLTGDALFIPGTAVVIIEDCEVKAHDWGLVYDWQLRSNRTVILRRVNGVAARMFIALMHSASTYRLVMEGCDIGIDGNLSQSYSETSASDPVSGGVLSPIVMRAGSGTATGCTFWVKGMTPAAGFPAKWVPTRIAAIATDHFNSKSNPAVRFAVNNFKVKSVEPGAAKVISDLDFRFGSATSDNVEREDKAKQAGDKLLAEARGGSGEDGTVKVWSAK